MNKQKQEYGIAAWMHHMRRGEFEKAWELSDEVLQSRAGKSCLHLPRHLQNIWDGTPLQGKRVLIRCYHGLGDTIQFIRYVPLVKAIAAEVIVWAQPPLLPLLEKIPGIDQLIPLHDGSPGVEYDTDVEIMELPHIFRTTPETIPGHVPYFQVEPLPLSAEDRKIAVGLVWKAGDWDESRSVAFSFLAPLADMERVQLYILQQNAASAGWQEGFGVNPGEYSLADYARVIKGLDLLITVDSMPAHMAGALGVPVWTLLHAGADWRWMENRQDSPWYPTMRLFRQPHPGDWASVISEVKAELERVAQGSIKI